MALIVKTEPAPDIVEMIDDDRDVFGDRHTHAPERETRRTSRWIGPAAAAALIAIVVYGVLSSAIDSAPSATPAVPDIIEPQYYVADAPPGFQMYLAEQRGDTDAAADFPEIGPAQLWATVDAGATAGSWFVVSRGSHHSTGRNSYRTTVDGIEVVIEHDPASRQSRVAFTKDGEALEITSFGWLDRQLVRLVRSVRVGVSTIGFRDQFFATDHKHILDADPAAALFGLPVARVGYTTALPAALADTFIITVADDNIVERAKVAKFALVQTALFTVDDRPAVVGQLASDPTVSIAQWRDGRRLITMRATIDTQQLEAIALTVHASSDGKVRDQLNDRSTEILQMVHGTPATVGSVTLADGWGSKIQVSTRIVDDPSAGYLWWIGQPGDSTNPTETLSSVHTAAPTIETFVENGRTYVLATASRSLTGSELHVNRTGFPSTVTPLVDVDPNLADQFAATAFVEPVPFTAQIVGGNGETLVSWPTF